MIHHERENPSQPLIAIVDDEPALLGLCAKFLASAGYRTETFSEPQAALDRLQEMPSSFAALITDFNMPGLSGRELAAAALKICPKLPIALLSGYLPPEEENAVSDLGFALVLPKPFTRKALLDAVAELLRKRD